MPGPILRSLDRTNHPATSSRLPHRPRQPSDCRPSMRFAADDSNARHNARDTNRVGNCCSLKLSPIWLNFLAVEKAIQPRHVAGGSFRRGAQPGDKSAIVGHGHFVDPALPGDVLADDFAVVSSCTRLESPCGAIVPTTIDRPSSLISRQAIPCHGNGPSPRASQRGTLLLRGRRRDFDGSVGRRRRRSKGDN